MTVQELKANAYDALSQVEAWQKRLAALNQEIVRVQEEEKKALDEAKPKSDNP